MELEEINKHYIELQRLLKLEKEEDFTFHNNQLATLTVKQKIEAGYLWRPVVVTKTGFTMGGRISITVEHKSVTSPNHQLQPGRPVIFYSEGTNDEDNQMKATVYSVGKNTMKLISNARELPEWLNKPPLAVQAEFDERTYRLMENALEEVINSKEPRVREFKKIFAGLQPPIFSHETYPFTIPILNESQNQALQHVMQSKDLAIIHGPPGTGKTTTLVQIIKKTVETEKQVLVTAPSNVAVDLLVERLVQAGVKTVRIGNISRIDETLLAHTLDGMVESHHEFPNIKKIRIEAAAVRSEASKYKRHFTHTEKEERTRLRKEAKDLEAWAKDLEERITESILDSAQVIATTLTSCNNDELSGRKYSTIFLDEASQALEPAAWIAMLKADRIVMAGDPLQLPPTVKSTKAAKAGLDNSLLEKSISLNYPSYLLDTQYRMHNDIMTFSNVYFYKGKLQTASEIKSKTQNQTFKAVIFIDTAGTGFEEQMPEETSKDMHLSRYNEGEYFILREHLLRLISEHLELKEKNIVVITPYRAQVRYINDRIQEDETLYNLNIRVSSIDGYQGQESDIVIISLVRSNVKGEIGFLKDYRRMNVAMTRAKLHLAIIGDSATLSGDKFFSTLIDHVNDAGQYHSAYEYMY